MLCEEIKALEKATPRDLRKFGLTMGGIFLGLGLLFLLRHKPWWPWFASPGAPLVVLGALLPRTLKWIYVAWMTLALVMGALVSTILLTVLFYVVVTPIGLIARMVGKDFLSQKIEPGAASYWIRRDVSKPKARQKHERQF